MCLIHVFFYKISLKLQDKVVSSAYRNKSKMMEIFYVNKEKQRTENGTLWNSSAYFYVLWMYTII